jgi:diguanylate cyclase (GGDEF)-like protein
VCLVTVGFLRWGAFEPALTASVPYVAGAAFAAGALLAWRFHRGRAVLLLLVIAGTAVAAGRAAAIAPPTDQSTFVRCAVQLLLPVNILWITLVAERGVVTPGGLVRASVIALEAALVAGVALTYPATAVDWLTRELVPAATEQLTALPQPALLAFLVAGSGLIVNMIARPGGAARVSFWALVASFLALHSGANPSTATAYFAAAGLIVAVGVMEATYFMAYRDGLTGLPARRALNTALVELGSRYSIAMVDVDRFKKFNDQHGHDVGDQVLRMVAKHLEDVSGGGKAYRYGGEEFAIVFPGKTRDDCLPHLEWVREAIAAAEFTLRGWRRPRNKPKSPRVQSGRRKHLAVTVSIGLAERNGRHSTPEKVVKAADQALYRAKKAGRNRVRQ